MPTIVTLPGDGIGPEVLASALEVLAAVADDLAFEEQPFGGASIDAHGTALTDETLAACKAADAVLLAAVGGPQWDSTDPNAPRPEQGLLGLRKGLGLYANLRPVRPFSALLDASPLKRELIEGTDMLVVRELTGGIYFGAKTRTADRASDLCEYIDRGDRADHAHRLPGRALARDQRRQDERAGDEPAVARGRHPRALRGVPERRARAPARRLGRDEARRAPRHFDVILTENMFGDILSDEAAMLTGSLGMLPSASLGWRSARACSSPSTARPRTSRGPARPTRWR